MQYAVQPGDSPWLIALRFAGDSTRWGELVAANPHKPRLRDGNFAALEPGEVLELPAGWLAPTSSSEAGELPDGVEWKKGYGGEYSSDLRFFKHPKNKAPNHEWWSDRAWDLWLDMAEAIDADPEAMLAFAVAESWLQPWAVGPQTMPDGTKQPFVWGLFQLTKGRSAQAGVPESDRLRWLAEWRVPHTAEQQIPYMRRYWEALNRERRNGKGFGGLSEGVFYAYNFAPARVGRGTDDTVLYSNRPEDAGTRVYSPAALRSNSGLDRNKDGRITIGELGEAVREKRDWPLFKLAKQRLDEARKRRGSTGDGTIYLPPAPLPRLPRGSGPKPDAHGLVLLAALAGCLFLALD